MAVDLGGLAAFGSKLYATYAQDQQQRADQAQVQQLRQIQIQQAQAAAQQQQIQQQGTQAYGATLMPGPDQGPMPGFGPSAAPPPQAGPPIPPMAGGPGGPPMPAPPMGMAGGQPMPMQPMSRPAPPMGPGGPQQGAAAPPQPAGLPSGPQAAMAQGGAPGASPGGGQMPTTVTPQQIAQVVMNAPGNRGIDWQSAEGKQILVQAVDSMQARMAPQVAAAWQQYKQQYQEGQDTLTNGRLDRTEKATNQYRQDELGLNKARLDEDKREHDLTNSRLTANGAGGKLDDATATTIAQALNNGNDTLMNKALGFSKNRPALVAQILAKSAELDPTMDGGKLAQMMLQYGGQRQAAAVVGRTEGSTAVGTEEIKTLVPKIMKLAKDMNPSQYPDVNAIEQAFDKKTGGADIVTLNSYIQSLKNAYLQIMARGGRMSDTQRTQAAELISGKMPLSQLAAAGNAMITEGDIVKGAASAAMKSVTGQGGGQGQTDPLGIRGGQGASPFKADAAPGMVQPGNIDIHARPVVHNPDGSISTVRSITITDDKGRAVLIPTVIGNRVVSNREAIDAYKRTGQNLGIFKDEDAADAYAESLHEEQADEYGGR